MTVSTQSNHRWPFRASETVLAVYFFYLSVVALFVHDRPHADGRLLLLAAAVLGLISFLIWAEKRSAHSLVFSIIRDWIALAFVLAAYRSLDWFSPSHYPFRFEPLWLQWDVQVLEHWGWRGLIESTALLPAYLEICYLLTSAAGGFALAVLYLKNKRERCDCFLLVYVLGTLLSYALIPFFPSQPPRVIYPLVAAPHIPDSIRVVNFLVLSGAGIHAGVFPSAHVSSTFAAAWGMFRCLPEHRIYGCIFLVYAASVAVATVYGRYHYGVDAVAGVAVSLAAWLLATVWQKSALPASPKAEALSSLDPSATR
jgi:membrane-associated phospholipid phosphatase